MDGDSSTTIKALMGVIKCLLEERDTRECVLSEEHVRAVDTKWYLDSELVEVGDGPPATHFFLTERAKARPNRIVFVDAENDPSAAVYAQLRSESLTN